MADMAATATVEGASAPGNWKKDAKKTNIANGKADATPPLRHYDVTAVASLRQQLGGAATAMKFIGFVSLTQILAGSIALPLITLIFAFVVVVTKGLRRGSTWAVMLAGISSAMLAPSVVSDILENWTTFSGLDEFKFLLGVAIYVIPACFVARGLFAFVAYRTHQRHGRSLTDPLAASPYEERLSIKKHPKFINKRRLKAYWLLSLSLLPYLLVWTARGTQAQKGSDIPTAMALGEWTFGVAITLATFVWGVRIYRRGRRAAMLPGSKLMERDNRPSVLYLRSFQDDGEIKLRARNANGRILLERLVKIPFEEVVTDHLWGCGPVVAIGDPNKKNGPAPLGAARDYVDHESWQQKATERMREAAMIVVIAAKTPGLAWEVNRIAKMGMASKLVILLPPVPAEDLRDRWQSLAGHSESGLVPPLDDLARLRALIFPEGTVAFISGTKSNDWTYEAVLDEAALVITNQSKALQGEAWQKFCRCSSDAELVEDASHSELQGIVVGINGFGVVCAASLARGWRRQGEV